MSTITQEGRLLSLKTPLGEDVLLIRTVSMAEAMSRPFAMELEMLADRPKASSVEADKLVGKTMTVSTELPSGGQRHFHGMVSRFTFTGRDARFVYYRAEVVPWLWLLSLSTNCRVFQDQTVPEIVEQIFGQWQGDYPELVNYTINLSGSYTKLDYCLQYRESDLQFVSRLMEQEGIFFYITHEQDKHTVVVGDAASATTACSGQDTVRFEPEAGPDPTQDAVASFDPGSGMVSGKFVTRDFHFQMPDKDLEVSEAAAVSMGNNAPLERYEFPGDYAPRFNKPDARLGDVESHGQEIVRLRMQAEEVEHLTINGTSTCRAFLPGTHFGLTGKNDQSIVVSGTSGRYLITSVRHIAQQSPDYVSGNPAPVAYQNSFTCISQDVTFRPRRVTPRPVMQGLQSAWVVGKQNEEIWTDKYGRVRVQFHWDREGQKDENSTCWLRVAQAWAGKQWGAHFWPRIGHEVLVAFLEGDPHRPVIVGSLYNAENMPPYEMPDNQTRSGVKSRTTKDGGSDNFNELRFEDKKDEEEIYLHAERDFVRVVENDDTLRVGFDKKDDGDQKIEVFNNQEVTIGDPQASDGSQTTEIWKDQATTLKTGDRSVTVEMGNHSLELQLGNQTTTLSLGKSTTEAMQGIELKVGQSSVKVDQTGVTIKGMMVKINGTVMTEVKGLMTTVKGDAMLTIGGGIMMIG